tara:strand:- start:52 stop:444 length:393 start_codon:yes stop_codon:yes gene_type:complete
MTLQIQGTNREEFILDDNFNYLLDDEGNPILDEYAWEDFKYELRHEFRQHIGKSYVVTSKNHGWNNETVKGKFELNNIDAIFKWFPDTDWNVVITKKTNAKNTYHFKISEHDGTSDYKIVFKKFIEYLEC